MNDIGKELLFFPTIKMTQLQFIHIVNLSIMCALALRFLSSEMSI